MTAITHAQPLGRRRHNAQKTTAPVAMGLDSATELRPWHIMRRTSPTDIKHYGELFEWLTDRDLLGEGYPQSYTRAMSASSAESFEHAQVG